MKEPATPHKFRLVFMGTPDFAVATLDALVKDHFDVLAVVTAPDKPAGRGMKLQESPVKKYAVKHGIPVLQPVKLRDPLFLEELRGLNADLFVVVAFRMLPELVWNMPEQGTINLHASLLPKYRGAAPINWAIIRGENETGITTFKLQHAIDTGDILLQESIPIAPDETAGELHDRMMVTGAALVVRTIRELENENLAPVPQASLTEEELPTAPKIFTETARINWQQDAREIHNLIRGLSPFPGAFTDLGDKTLKIFRSSIENAVPVSRPGRWESDGKNWLKFACANGYIHCLEVQLEGKKRMPVGDFLRGYRLT